MNSINIRQSNGMLSLQNAGFFKQAHLGISSNEPIDLEIYSHLIDIFSLSRDDYILEAFGANHELIFNSAHTKIKFSSFSRDQNIYLNSKKIENYVVYNLENEDVLRIDSKSWSYIAFNGRFNNIQNELRNWYSKEKRFILRANVNNKVKDYSFKTIFKPHEMLNYHPTKILSEDLKLQLEKNSFYLGHNFDRCGIRLEGKEIRHELSEIRSHGTPLGGIQLPPNGKPIVLGPARQTVGGYPIIGVLPREELSKLYFFDSKFKFLFKAKRE